MKIKRLCGLKKEDMIYPGRNMVLVSTHIMLQPKYSKMVSDFLNNLDEFVYYRVFRTDVGLYIVYDESNAEISLLDHYRITHNLNRIDSGFLDIIRRYHEL